MEKKVALRLFFCACLLSMLKCTLGDMCGTKSFNPPRYRCCGEPGREQIVYDTTNEMCLRDIYSGIYHTRSVYFNCGNLPNKYDYRNQLCIMDIKTRIFRIISRFAYCNGIRYDHRFFYCYYDVWTGLLRLKKRTRRSVFKKRYLV